ncbi:hypothetical protein KR018_005579 [Drosophila ironensis]|nr:hypothetical protein KR018_005579 [Drosophila ironensis]
MKLQWQILLGLVLVFALLATSLQAKSLEEVEEDDESLSGDAESDESQPEQGAIQADYLDVANYVPTPSPWWWN